MSLYFHSDGSTTFWGVRLFVHPVMDEKEEVFEYKTLAPILSSNVAKLKRYGYEEELALLASVKWDKWCYWETGHPYSDNMDWHDSVIFPGAQKLVMVFDNHTQTENTHDWLKIFPGDEDNNVSINDGENFCGSYADFWSRKHPVVINNEKASFYFHSDGSSVFWGVRIFIFAIYGDEPEEDWLAMGTILSAKPERVRKYGEELVSADSSMADNAGVVEEKVEAVLETFARSDFRVWETPHPYFPNMDVVETIRIEGASQLILLFDPSCLTENTHDWLRIYPNATSTDMPLFNDSPLCGDTANFLNANATTIQGDTVTFKFHTDGSTEMWGVRIYIRAIRYGPEKMDIMGLQQLYQCVDMIRGPSAAPGAAAASAEQKIDWGSKLPPTWQIWETPHPYDNNQEYFQSVTIPKSKCLMLYFSPECKTETNCDWVAVFRGNSTSSPMLNGQQLSGDFDTGFAPHNPVVIPGDTVGFKFRSDPSSVFWGVRVFIKGIAEHPEGSNMPPMRSLFSDFPILNSPSLPLLYTMEILEHIIYRSIPSQRVSYEPLFREIRRVYQSGSSVGCGFLASQSVRSAEKELFQCDRSCHYIYALQLIGTVLPELSKQELQAFVEANGAPAGLIARLVWTYFRAVTDRL